MRPCRYGVCVDPAVWPFVVGVKIPSLNGGDKIAKTETTVH